MTSTAAAFLDPDADKCKPKTAERRDPIDYYAINVGGGVVASVTVVDDRSAAEEAERRLAGWVEETQRLSPPAAKSLIASDEDGRSHARGARHFLTATCTCKGLGCPVGIEV